MQIYLMAQMNIVKRFTSIDPPRTKLVAELISLIESIFGLNKKNRKSLFKLVEANAIIKFIFQGEIGIFIFNFL